MDSHNNNSGPKDQAAVNAPMDQVREILFGAQLKDMEVRFKRQEERLLREIHDVKDSLRQRLDSLENFMKSEVSSLLERLRSEQQERDSAFKAEQRDRTEALQAEQRERSEALKNEQRERAESLKTEERDRLEAVSRLSGDISNAVETFERKLAKLANTFDAAERDIRTLLLNESGHLNNKIESKYADALNVLSKTAAQIRNDMVYRTALTGMFAEMVGSFSKPWNEDHLEDVDQATSEDQSQHYDQDRQPEPDEEQMEDLPQVAQVGSADNY